MSKISYLFLMPEGLFLFLNDVCNIPPFNFMMPSVHLMSYLVRIVMGVMAYDAMIVPIVCRFICGPPSAPSGSDFTALACHHDDISNYQMSFCMNQPIMAVHVPPLFENTFTWTQYTVIIQMLICADNRAHSKWKVGCMLKTFRLICTLPPFVLNFKAHAFFVNTIMPVRPPFLLLDFICHLSESPSFGCDMRAFLWLIWLVRPLRQVVIIAHF